MQQDNTSTQVEELASQKDENTQETSEVVEPVSAEETTGEDVNEQVEPQKSGKIFGKYQSLEDAKKGYANLTERARKAEEELKRLKSLEESKKFDELGNLPYDDQVKFLAEKLKEQEEFRRKLEEEMAEQSQEIQLVEDRKALETFISQNPILVETGLDEEFRLIATHPDMQEFTFESIYAKKLKPKLDKLMGTKLTVREKSLKGDVSIQKQKSIGEMSMAEYEANREKILEDFKRRLGN